MKSERGAYSSVNQYSRSSRTFLPNRSKELKYFVCSLESPNNIRILSVDDSLLFLFSLCAGQASRHPPRMVNVAGSSP